jgi:hypothetical protein
MLVESTVAANTTDPQHYRVSWDGYGGEHCLQVLLTRSMIEDFYFESLERPFDSEDIEHCQRRYMLSRDSLILTILY